ncbi:periplasmic heavy metal sensor [Nioella nitratireducens]|uniref:periplasmic heavy metal sensor n=1 Tax=Nioella nitratireducens TaxID=1287720 RepID=UPI0008FD8EBB|nr:periplasmic heavy metal sensor [Nioella nitratireducens]
MDETTETPRKRPGRGLKIALGLSLALNLLVLGAVGGAVLNGGPDGRLHDRMDLARTLGLGPVGAALDGADRDALMDRARQDRDDLRARREGLLADTLAFAEAVRSDPFDRSAAAALLEDQRARVNGLQQWGHEALLDRLDRMPWEARAAFADRLTSALSRHQHR